MALIFKTDIERGGAWRAAFAKQLPDVELRLWPEVGAAEEIEYAVVWQPPAGFLASLPNLKAVFSIGAGIDHLLADPELPRGVPIIRMVEPGLTVGMTQFVVMACLMLHRSMIDYRNQQVAHHWEEISQEPPENRRIGIIGLGHLGGEAAKALRGFGFPVSGWSRSRKQIEGVTSYAGEEELSDFLARTDILVSLLPLTPQTEDMIDAKLLSGLPKGASFVSAGRGRQVVEEDLLAALDSGQLSGAVLDVFREEPLPKDSRFWDHPRVIVLPHVASMTNPATAVGSIVENIRRIQRGEAPLHQVDLEKGY
ncbi:2-hydroxyacid dehydrogenase [Limibacillus halophilus]